MKRIFAAMLLLTLCAIATPAQNDIELALRRLDTIVDNAPKYAATKEAELHRTKNNLRLAVSDVDKYLSCKQIAEAYSQYMSDSALVYYRRCYNYGTAAGNKTWMQDAAIHQAMILADRGDNHMATDRLRMLGTIDDIVPQLKPLYADAAMMVFVRVSNTSQNQFSTSLAKNAWKVYEKYINKLSSHHTLYYTIANPDYNPAKVAKLIETNLKSTPKGSDDESMYRMLLGICMEKQGEMGKAIIEFARSAAIDLKNSKTNSSSLTMLIAGLNKDKEENIGRLLKYTQQNIDNINLYNDVGRSIHLVNAQKPILLRYQKAMQQRMTNRTIIAVLVAMLLIACAYFTWRLHRKNATIEEQSNMLKANLLSLQTQMRHSQDNVIEKDATIGQLKQERIRTGQIMAQQLAYLSQALNDMKAFKKDIANLIASGRTAEARKMTKETVTKDRTQALFCDIFDHSFLDIHPDFPARLNQLLSADAQLSADNGSLTPEQRIYALISLGVDDSRNIAEILHYSIQTVYNYRMKMRHASASASEKVDDVVKTFYL